MAFRRIEDECGAAGLLGVGGWPVPDAAADAPSPGRGRRHGSASAAGLTLLIHGLLVAVVVFLSPEPEKQLQPGVGTMLIYHVRDEAAEPKVEARAVAAASQPRRAQAQVPKVKTVSEPEHVREWREAMIAVPRPSPVREPAMAGQQLAALPTSASVPGSGEEVSGFDPYAGAAPMRPIGSASGRIGEDDRCRRLEMQLERMACPPSGQQNLAAPAVRD